MSNEQALTVAQHQQSAMVEVQKSRELQSVQGAIISAKKFPRDTNQAFLKIMESCKRIGLAQVAIYSYPKGGATVSGPSIRLAEVLAQNYGNLDFGVKELERRDGASIAESYCWDLETNTRQSKIFEVPHIIGTKNGPKTLADPRDIYELVANQGARRLRSCILGIIPGDIVEAAENQCRETLKKGTGEPIEDRIRKMIAAFKVLGISQEMIEKRLEHKIDLTTSDEIVELQGIHNALRDKQAKTKDFFASAVDEAEESKSRNLTEMLRAKSNV